MSVPRHVANTSTKQVFEGATQLVTLAREVFRQYIPDIFTLPLFPKGIVRLTYPLSRAADSGPLGIGYSLDTLGDRICTDTVYFLQLLIMRRKYKAEKLLL